MAKKEILKDYYLHHCGQDSLNMLTKTITFITCDPPWLYRGWDCFETVCRVNHLESMVASYSTLTVTFISIYQKCNIKFKHLDEDIRLGMIFHQL